MIGLYKSDKGVEEPPSHVRQAETADRVFHLVAASTPLIRQQIMEDSAKALAALG